MPTALITGDRTIARRRLTDLVAEFETTRIDGDRFAFDPCVESAESANRADSKLAALFAERITVYGTDQLQAVRKTVMAEMSSTRIAELIDET